MNARVWGGRFDRVVGSMGGAMALWCLIGFSPLAAQEPVSESVKVPSLYGHVFIPPTLIQDPFVRTNVLNSLGAGQAVDVDFGTIVLPDGDTLVALNGDLTFAVLEFQYQHALRDWLGVWGKVDVAARVGTNVGSLLSSGVTLSTGFEFGWLAQVRETDRSLLSVSAKVRNTGFTVIDLPSWVDDIINGETASLVRTTPALRVGGGLHYAWVLNDVVGFMMGGETSFGESLKERNNEWYFTGGGGVSLNFQQRYGVPLGVGLSVTADSYPSVNGEQTRGWQGVGLKLAYTGRDDIVISLTSQGQRVPFQDDQRMKVALISFDMRYFF